MHDEIEMHNNASIQIYGILLDHLNLQLFHAGPNTTIPDLPWAGSCEQMERIRARIAAMRTDEDSRLYSGVAEVAFQKAFGSSGSLKTSEYLLLGGPIGKYLLQGVFHAEQQQGIFR